MCKRSTYDKPVESTNTFFQCSGGTAAPKAEDMGLIPSERVSFLCSVAMPSRCYLGDVSNNSK